MAYTPQDVTEGELQVLQVLWDRGKSSIRQITDSVYRGGGPAQYATVQKMLERLEAKGFVKRDRSLHVHLFTAAVDREGFIDRRLRALAKKLCDGSMTPLLMHLVRDVRLSPQERKMLEAIIDRMDQKSKPRDSRR